MAEDVHQQRLTIGPEHQQLGPENFEIAILNSKGFGGNNASAVVLSPARTESMLSRRHGDSAVAEYRKKRAASLNASEHYFHQADKGEYAPIYRFGEGMIADEDITIDRSKITVRGLTNAIELPRENSYPDMTE